MLCDFNVLSLIYIQRSLSSIYWLQGNQSCSQGGQESKLAAAILVCQRFIIAELKVGAVLSFSFNPSFNVFKVYKQKDAYKFPSVLETGIIKQFSLYLSCWWSSLGSI